MQPDTSQKKYSTIDQAFSSFWALGLMILIAASWRLWFPITESAYPMIPLLPIPNTILGGLNVLGIIASTVLIVALFQCVISRGNSTWWMIVSISLLICFLSDQHRLQPWAYQSFLYSMLFGTLQSDKWKKWMLPIIVSIYAYSAAGKYDAQFFHTVGNEMIGFMGRVSPFELPILSSEYRHIFVAIFPTSEILIALLLIFKRSRAPASIAAICMHLSLIAILGPWGKNHSFGVLLWNAMLIGQHLYLITCSRLKQRAGQADSNPSSVSGYNSKRIPVLFCTWTIVLVAPCLERTGFWDHWTSWSLYSPHTSRARIEFHQSVVNSLGKLQRQALISDDDQDQWYEIDLGTWSLAERSVPVYPQARYQLDLAHHLAQDLKLENEIRVKLQGVSNRKTGERIEERLLNLKEIKNARKQFWLHPR